ncbi:uncharacterized protein GIQ15_02924 [Arthroderma uncinatum]|uniref:uncharacterized protein n=1 Tax=Arthroderma uncinatum TaxID=74035 RepID=UPI00144AEE10|nr:uncharacterized protein GIQ15_02924 [Arthroderma uncinatum]KAF3483600.1 hypothetical protein GIQ15_02924 [Arthroderma uncinatum]
MLSQPRLKRAKLASLPGKEGYPGAKTFSWARIHTTIFTHRQIRCTRKKGSVQPSPTNHPPPPSTKSPVFLLDAMAATARPNVSDDLVWGIARTQNAYLVKRSTGGGAQFSRDPLNLINKHSRKAIGVQAGENGGVAVTTKKAANTFKPASNTVTANHGSGSANRKVYKGVANRAVTGGYRADLRPEAVLRASAIRKSQRPKKDSPEKKLRGAKARKAAEKDA